MAIDILMNQRVRFQSLAPNDPNIYVGVITSIISPKMALSLHDIVGSTEIIKQNNSSLANLDYRYLNYFVLSKESTLNDSLEDIVFAKEWIDESTFSVIDTLNNATIKIIGVTSENLQIAIELLRENGFSVTLESYKQT